MSVMIISYIIIGMLTWGGSLFYFSKHRTDRLMPEDALGAFSMGAFWPLSFVVILILLFYHWWVILWTGGKV